MIQLNQFLRKCNLRESFHIIYLHREEIDNALAREEKEATSVVGMEHYDTLTYTRVGNSYPDLGKVRESRNLANCISGLHLGDDEDVLRGSVRRSPRHDEARGQARVVDAAQGLPHHPTQLSHYERRGALAQAWFIMMHACAQNG